MDVRALDADVHQLRQSAGVELAPPVTLDPLHGGEASLNTDSGEREDKCNIKQLQNIANLLLSSLVRGKLSPKGRTLHPHWQPLHCRLQLGPLDPPCGCKIAALRS